MKFSISSFYKLHKKQVKIFGAVIIIGLLYFILTELTPLRIPCMFRLITGYACPGCGITRLFMALLHGDISLAFSQNPVVFVLLPVWAAAALIRIFLNPSWMAKGSKAEKLFLFATVGILLAFAVLRNIPGMEFLLPEV